MSAIEGKADANGRAWSGWLKLVNVRFGLEADTIGDIVAYPILGGLHHRYARI
jgi:hypothetical protein